MRLKIHPLVRPISAFLACVLMTVIYFQSGHPLPIRLDSFSLQDKLVHAAAYGVLACLFLFSQKLTPQGFTLKQQLLAMSLATLYGLSDEWHQSFIPERNADTGDFIADSIGAILAVSVTGRLSRRYLILPKT